MKEPPSPKTEKMRLVEAGGAGAQRLTFGQIALDRLRWTDGDMGRQVDYRHLQWGPRRAGCSAQAGLLVSGAELGLGGGVRGTLQEVACTWVQHAGTVPSGLGRQSLCEPSQCGLRLLSDQQSHLVSIDWLKEEQLARPGQEGGEARPVQR